MKHPDYEFARLWESEAVDPDFDDAVQCGDCLEFWSSQGLPGEDNEECPDCGSTCINGVEKD